MELLKDYQAIVWNIDSYLKELKELERLERSIGECTGSKALKQLFERKIDTLKKKKKTIDTLVDQASPETAEAIRFRFYEGLPWADIAEKMHCSKKTAQRLCKKFSEGIENKEGMLI